MGSSYSRQLGVNLPLIAELLDGDYFILVRTDVNGFEQESNETNNLAATGIALTLPALPDLAVTSVVAPKTGQPGETTAISFTVENRGRAPATISWSDSVYLTTSGTTVGARLLATLVRPTALAMGASYTVSRNFVLPEIADGDYRVLVVSDVTGAVFESNLEANNQGLSAEPLELRHADLLPSALSAPATATSGTTLSLTWSTTNRGARPTLRGWQDNVYLSTDSSLSANDLLLGSYTRNLIAAPGEVTPIALGVSLPLSAAGNYFLLVKSDASNDILEGVDEANNVVSRPLAVTLAPYADLAVSQVNGPGLVIGDPASLTVSWTVSNSGTGRGITDVWTDAVVASTDAIVGNSDDRVLARFTHTGGLDKAASYSRTETFLAPPAYTGQYHLYVKSDIDQVVFENLSELNNTSESDEILQIMPIPYADLIVSTIAVPGGGATGFAFSGQPYEFTWTVENQGLGTTNIGTWIDRVELTTDAAGTHRVAELGDFEHFGHLAVGERYTRRGLATLPNGLSGTYYLVVTAAKRNGPFEFVYSNNNATVSTAIPIALTAPPDLTVTHVSAPPVADEGDFIDISWTIRNVGTGAASGTWVDQVFLQKAGDPSATTFEVGKFRYTGTLAANTQYVRSEAVRLPSQVNDNFNVFVRTNFEEELYEHGATGNNLRASDNTVLVRVLPRPDLQVDRVIAPAHVAAGGTIAVSFSIVNQGSVATNVPQWVDRVYLSLDNKLTLDDILLDEIGNQSALAPGDRYSSTTISGNVPERYRGDVFVLVIADATDKVGEWPNNENNLTATPVYVDPLPLADLIVSQIVAPTQSVEGAAIQVRYTVTNLGRGPTNVAQWSDSIWLTRDKNRPHPGQGDVLLGTYAHTGVLPRNAGYDQVVNVTLPTLLDSGVYYIMPWTDPFGNVLEDTIADNANPDDPNAIDGNNYSARAIDIIGVLPDLRVTSVTSTSVARGGDAFNVSWTVKNDSTGTARPGGWFDRVYLSDNPDPFAKDAHSTMLGEVRHNDPLGVDGTYPASISITLSPSAIGQYISVVTDDNNGQVGLGRVKEIQENNNRTTVATRVTPVPADLRVTNIVIPSLNYSGEKATISYTVTNEGAFPVWQGTRYWKDFLWVSADPTFIRERASYLGEVVTSLASPLQPGGSYTVTTEVSLPKGTRGTYYFYIHLDAHNDLSPVLFPYQARLLRTDWWPGDTGTNAQWLDEFSRWAFEDPRNNLAIKPFEIIYKEPDLAVTDLQLPVSATSGQGFPVTFTVRNQGNRATREQSWNDRVFLSLDPSLDNHDLYLGQVGRSSVLAEGTSYTSTLNVTLPDGIEGNFYVLVFSDSAAKLDRFQTSDIGFGLPGVEFERPNPLAPWDLASVASRSLARGSVPEFQFEANNIVSKLLPVTLATPPDLQVISIEAPQRALLGELLQVAYTVQNLGGVIPSTQDKWDDLVYLSRDRYLDLLADRYLGTVPHTGVLGPNGSYRVSRNFTLPRDLLGPYYVFVITDPVRGLPIGKVFEHTHEDNNDRASDLPVVIELPPPTDLEVTSIEIPASGSPGGPVDVRWTVTNIGHEFARGSWSDAVYLSKDATWDISDRLLGRAAFTGELIPGESYTKSLSTTLPAVLPGKYRVIVRTDIFNQVYEDVADANNATTSAETIALTVDSLQLGVPYLSTLSVGQERLLQVVVPSERTLRVTLQAADGTLATELFLKHDRVPTPFAFDAAYEGGLASTQTALIPSTQPGVYYVLVRGHSGVSGKVPVFITAELLPLQITSVHTDRGGDTAYVTTTIRGAEFHPNAIVKLQRPGFAEFIPTVQKFFDSTKIVATFDFRGAPHGLYDIYVINPDGTQAIVPYRFEVERALEPDVTIGLGGPRIILAGDVGTYSVALPSISNVDTPYTFFQVGIPELGINQFVYNLPYARLNTNLRGTPPADALNAIPWASLESTLNQSGQVLASGYLLDQAADDFTGFTFNVTTYAGLRELHDRAFSALRDRLYAAFPAIAKAGVLDDGPEGLNDIYPGLYDIFAAFGDVPDCLFTAPFVPFQFHVAAAATAMTRDEFIAHSLKTAEDLRTAILADDSASPSLLTFAANSVSWGQLYLASLEQAGLLRPAGNAPPIRENPLVISQLAVLASGILAGPVGDEFRTSSDLTAFFDKVRAWYGSDPDTLAPTDPDAPTFSAPTLAGLFCPSVLTNINPIAKLPTFKDFDLGLSSPTHFAAFNVYVPWVDWAARGRLPADYGINGLIIHDADEPVDLNLSRYLQDNGTISGLASLVGPYTTETNGFLPVDVALPYSIHFQNDPDATRYVNEVRVVTQLDANLDARSFRLGDIKIGDITVHVPAGRSIFQGDFDFVQSRGFVLRVSAGVDLSTETATWLLQAIDPLSGELLQDSSHGMLQPNNAQGQGAGFVGYTIEADSSVDSGSTVSAKAKVLFDSAPPEETEELVQTIDAAPPITRLTATPLAGGAGSNYLLKWNSSDESNGSGVKHVTLYAAIDGGDFKIISRQNPNAESSFVFTGQPGRRYEFLALATDLSGNQEQPPFGVHAASDGSGANLGQLPTVPGTTPDNFGQPPSEVPGPAVNPLFIQALQGIPAATTTDRPANFTEVLRPFVARAFATGFETSGAQIGPLALLELPSRGFWISGGTNRNQLFSYGVDGGAGTLIAELPYPIYSLTSDASGRLWATTGGGPLLKLDPITGRILAKYGDGLLTSAVVDPVTGQLFVTSSGGVEKFDPATGAFTKFSRDLNLRFGSLAIDNSGNLWGTVWPERHQIVKLTPRGRAEVMFEFDSDIDSIAFGKAGTDLAGLLLVSNNTGPRNRTGQVTTGSELIAIDLATRRRLAIAKGGSRGDVVITTTDGRILLSQSNQVDVINPIRRPVVVATNPPQGGVLSLPRTSLSVTFNSDMFAGPDDDVRSVRNPLNYRLVGPSGSVNVLSVTYDPVTRTAVLSVTALNPGAHTLIVAATIESASRLALGSSYKLDFRGLSDLTSSVQIQFLRGRTNAVQGTASYDVVVKNISSFDIAKPLRLYIDALAPSDASVVGGTFDPDTRTWWLSLDAFVTGDRLKPGVSTATSVITFSNPSGQRLGNRPGVLGQPYVNLAPVFTSSPALTATVAVPYSYRATATDRDGVSFTYLLADAPAGMTINSSTGVVSWTPTKASPAVATVRLHVYDARGGLAEQVFNIDVACGNHVPQLGSLPVTLIRAEGQTLAFRIEGSDQDNDALVFWADNLPPGARFDSVNRTFTWAPGYEAAGTYENVRFFVSDGISQDSHALMILVSPTDRPPTLARPVNRTLREGDRLRLFLEGLDTDGDNVVYSSSNLPEGAVLDPLTGMLDWSVGYAQAGVHEITFMAISGQESVSQTAIYTVLNANAAPSFDALDGWRVYEGEEITFRAFAADPDNPEFSPQSRLSNGSLSPLDDNTASVRYSVTGLPIGANFDADTGIFRWTPGYSSVGSYVIQVTATDDGNGTGVPLSSTTSVTIQVLNLNRRPEIVGINPVSLQRGQSVDLYVQAVDPDGNALVLSAADARPNFALPGFVSFQDMGGGRGVFHFAPGRGDRGNYGVQFQATDDGDGTGPLLSQVYSFVVTVVSPNEAPELEYRGSHVALVDQPLVIPILASDLDQEPLQFSLNGLPVGATLTPGSVYGTAELNWHPARGQEGNYTATVTVTDHGNGNPALVANDALSFKIVVRASNSAPTLAPIADVTAAELQKIEFTVAASDSNLDNITFVSTGLPEGATLDPVTGKFAWTPTLNQSGQYRLTIGATDGPLEVLRTHRSEG